MPSICMGDRTCALHRTGIATTSCTATLRPRRPNEAIHGGHRRAAGMSSLAPSRHHMHAADPRTRDDRSSRPPSCFRKTPATRVRRTSQVLCRSESLAKRTRREWMGEHGMVAGMEWRASEQLYGDIGARGRRRDRRSASDAHACDIERAKRRHWLRHSWSAGRAGRPPPKRAP